jgi:hypothetical protein
VFISGDRQDMPFPSFVPNVNGCLAYSSNTFRGDATQANPWENVVGYGAHGTSPHPDSRALVFDANGNLLLANDGGVYRLQHPDDPNTRIWVSLDSNLRTAEFHSIAYDPVSHIIIGGTQDHGTPMQSAPGSLTYTDFTSGDGGVVAVDSNQTAHPGTSIRYSSEQFLSYYFNRSTWDANNHLLNTTIIGLNIVSGPNAGQNLLNVDPTIQYYQPFVLNAVDPTRMLIDTANIYESFNQGDSLYDLGTLTAASPGGGFDAGTPMVYGGRLNGVANADMFYVADNAGLTSAGILHRVHAGGPITNLTAYPGGSIVALVADPRNYRHLFVVDAWNRIWATFDEGKTFVELTANLHNLTQDRQGRTIEFYASPDSPSQDVLLVGAEGGVFAMKHFDRAGAQWQLLGTGLPHTIVFDLHYDYRANLLLAGTLGRGAWTLSNPFRQDGQNAGVGGGDLAAWSMLGASAAALNRSPQGLDALFATITGGPANEAGNVGIQVPESRVPDTTAAPPSIPGSTGQLIPLNIRNSGTPSSSLTRRVTHGLADYWSTDLSLDGNAAGF